MKSSKFVFVLLALVSMMSVLVVPISAQDEEPECMMDNLYSNPDTDDADTANYVAIAIYPGVDEAQRGEFVELVNDGFVPLVAESEGFIGYFNADLGEDGWIAVRVFDNEESAAASAELASDWVAENIADLLPEAPITYSGRVDIRNFDICAEEGLDSLYSNPDTDDTETADYVAIAVYPGVDEAQRGEFAELVNDGFVPLVTESEGFIAYVNADLGEDGWLALRVFDNEESAADSAELASDWVAENIADLLPEAPTTYAGRVDIRVMAVPMMEE